MLAPGRFVLTQFCTPTVVRTRMDSELSYGTFMVWLPIQLGIGIPFGIGIGILPAAPTCRKSRVHALWAGLYGANMVQN